MRIFFPIILFAASALIGVPSPSAAQSAAAETSQPVVVLSGDLINSNVLVVGYSDGTLNIYPYESESKNPIPCDEGHYHQVSRLPPPVLKGIESKGFAFSKVNIIELEEEPALVAQSISHDWTYDSTTLEERDTLTQCVYLVTGVLNDSDTQEAVHDLVEIRLFSYISATHRIQLDGLHSKAITAWKNQAWRLVDESF